MSDPGEVDGAPPEDSRRLKRWYSGMPSPNPTGRPRDPLRMLAREKSGKAFDVIEAILDDVTQNAQTRLTAAKMIIERGHGTPVTMVAESTVEGDDAQPRDNLEALLLVGSLMLEAERNEADRLRAGLPPLRMGRPLTTAENELARRLLFVTDRAKRLARAEQQKLAITVESDTERTNATGPKV